MARPPTGRGSQTFGDQAAAGLVCILIATGLFAVAFGTVATMGQKQLAEASNLDRRVHVDGESARLAAEVLGRPGTGWYGAPCLGALPSPGAFQPDLVQRFGLAREDCRAAPPAAGLNLSQEKVKNIRRAAIRGTPGNGLLDYAEARASLALAGTDFHLRGRVTLPEAENVLAHGRLDPHLRPLYVGDYRKLGASWVPQASVRPEAAYIDAVLRGFDANVHLPLYHHPQVPYAPGGDVVPDLKAAVDAFLPLVLEPAGSPSLAVYNVLVVGSNVDSTALNSGPTKFAIERWVRGGGTLIVLGNDGHSFEWLQPLFHVGLRSASGALLVDQPEHAILHVPNDLVPAEFADGGNAWDIGAQDVDEFDIVATRGGATVAVSRPGAYGEGRVVLTSYRPFDATGQGPTGACDPATLQAACQGLQLLQNFLTIAYDELNFDYGPEPPMGAHVSVTQRIATVWVPGLHHVEVTVWTYAF